VGLGIVEAYLARVQHNLRSVALTLAGGASDSLSLGESRLSRSDQLVGRGRHLSDGCNGRGTSSLRGKVQALTARA